MILHNLAAIKSATLPNLATLIERHLSKPGAHYVKTAIAEDGYLPLLIEKIGKGPEGYDAFSFTHYYEQNGDRMRDPEISAERLPDGTFRPYYFRNDGVGYSHTSIRKEDETFVVDMREYRGVFDLIKVMDQNIDWQGHLDTALVTIG